MKFVLAPLHIRFEKRCPTGSGALLLLKSLLETVGDETSRGRIEMFLNATSNRAAVVFANCAESRN